MSQMTKFEEEYQQLVLQWANDRNIVDGSDNIKQLLKTLTEAGEFIDAIVFEDVDEFVDAIGDQWVTLVIGMEQSGILYQEALDSAMQLAAFQIIRRKGVVRVICTDPRHKQRQG